jgi:CRISPR-associated endonuclease/helicase Cas3
MNAEFLAHVYTSNGERQTLETHLKGVAALCLKFASNMGLETAGELIGLVHDLGKHSEEFQNYLKSAIGLPNPDEDEEFVDAKRLKGKIDYSAAGEQWVWIEPSAKGQFEWIAGQVLALCFAPHHPVLIDCDLHLEVAPL